MFSYLTQIFNVSILIFFTAFALFPVLIIAFGGFFG